MKTAMITALISLLVFASCSTQVEPFKYGTDICYNCKMGIIDPKFGGELVTKKGKNYKFDDVGCMVRYLKSGLLEQKDIAQTAVINFEKQNDFINVNKAIFAASDAIRSPMNFNAAAFSSKDAADKFLADKPGKELNWNELYNKIE